jgi:hypothetical protein
LACSVLKLREPFYEPPRSFQIDRVVGCRPFPPSTSPYFHLPSVVFVFPSSMIEEFYGSVVWQTSSAFAALIKDFKLCRVFSRLVLFFLPSIFYLTTCFFLPLIKGDTRC